MKALELLTNTEKVRALHELFPEDLPLFLEYLNSVCTDLEEPKDQYFEKWDSSFMSFSNWLSLANETVGILKRHKFNMAKNSRVFSDQLFFSYTSLFVNTCIVQYAAQISENQKLKIAVDLFYKV